MNNIATKKVGDFTVYIKYDDTPENPLIWSDCTFIHNAKQLQLVGNYKEELPPIDEKWVYLPVYMLDHGCVMISDTPFNDMWDSRFIGFIISNDCTQGESINTIKGALCRLREEIDTLNSYINGEVYMYLVKDTNNNICDCCAGYYTIDDAMSEGVKTAEGYLQNLDYCI